MPSFSQMQFPNLNPNLNPDEFHYLTSALTLTVTRRTTSLHILATHIILRAYALGGRVTLQYPESCRKAMESRTKVCENPMSKFQSDEEPRRSPWY